MKIKRGSMYKLGQDRVTPDLMSNETLLRGLDLVELERNGVSLPVHIVKQDEIFRPDILSRRIYGEENQDYYSYLLRVNGIIDPFNDLYAGMRLKYVPRSVLEEYISRSKSDKAK
jgi:hypothetical protein